MTLVAKPIVDKQYWILKQDNQKIGNVQQTQDGSFQITIGGQVANFKTIKNLRKQVEIEFADPEHKSKPARDLVHGYHTGCRAHNSMWDVKRKLPLFTKDAKSKSWYAAGWYLVKQHRTWKAVHNPKLIVLDRYQYRGPFYTREETNDQPVS
jgi:hypothetical protein